MPNNAKSRRNRDRNNAAEMNALFTKDVKKIRVKGKFTGRAQFIGYKPKDKVALATINGRSIEARRKAARVATVKFRVRVKRAAVRRGFIDHRRAIGFAG